MEDYGDDDDRRANRHRLDLERGEASAVGGGGGGADCAARRRRRRRRRGR